MLSTPWLAAIEFYNNKRFHQTLDYKKPMDVYCNLQPQLFLEAA
ncbi:hypothetical protein [Piscirickettsia salmonis]|nr:hypothetical protein [Piscirickettsia salmonis]